MSNFLATLRRLKQRPYARVVKLIASFLAGKEPTAIKRGRVACFVDGSNLHFSALHQNQTISFQELFSEMGNGAQRFQGARYYGVLDPSKSAQCALYEIIKQIGYRTCTRNIAYYQNGPRRTDLDAWIAADMIQWAPSFDTCVIVSADGDFAYAARILRKLGKRVEVWGFRGSTSRELTETASEFIDLMERGKVCQPKKRNKTVVGHH